MHQGWLLPAPGLGQASESLKAPRDPPPPAGCLSGSVPERASDCSPLQGVSSTGSGLLAGWIGSRGVPGPPDRLTFPQDPPVPSRPTAQGCELQRCGPGSSPGSQAPSRGSSPGSTRASERDALPR
uniref:Uncharacterized protein n=1 Tax=Molossus molossus TaxID=27622 RepID=A0A7J8E2M5_MOLMO|nr:hypothetical protein HJG59_009072 [Molossus molossus]